MDHTQMLYTLQNAIPMEIWYLIPLAILVAVIKSPWFKGETAESVVNFSTRLSLDKNCYHLNQERYPAHGIRHHLDRPRNCFPLRSVCGGNQEAR